MASMSAKSLGLVHTVNHRAQISASGDTLNIDLAAGLTAQLETMIRQGQTFKVVGIDANLDTVGTEGGGQVTGFIRYFAPTHGRCEAFRGAYRAMMAAQKNQGVNHRVNKMYDFKASFNNLGLPVMDNQATLDGTNGLALFDQQTPQVETASIFEVHNDSVMPQQTFNNANMYSKGYNTLGVQTDPTDFVLNEQRAFFGNRNVAHIGNEFIPFQLSWTPDSTDISVSMEWRPDPALYLSVMCGLFQVYIEEINLDGNPPASQLNITFAIHVSGWKSIMSKPKSRSRSKSKKRSRKGRK